MPKMPFDRPLGRRIVRLADDDRWNSCLSLLLSRRDQQAGQRGGDNPDPERALAWLGATTPDGDGLVHLCSFASCDSSLSLSDRRCALRRLEIVMEDDVFAVNRVAGDGGTALHAAFAAASSSDDGEGLECCSGDEVDEAGEEGTISDDSDFESHGDSGSENSDARDETGVPRLEMCREASVSDNSEQLICRAIQLLLDNGADPNTPLNNLIHVAHGEDEDNELELTYAREAVTQGWTPLTMALQWAALTSAASGARARTNKEDAGNGGSPSDVQLILSLRVLQSLLDAGADPTCPIGASINWNAFEFVASCSYHLRQATTTRGKLLVSDHGVDVGDGFENHLESGDGEAFSVYQHVQKMLQRHTHTSLHPPPLSEVQLFAAAIISNDVASASRILATQSEPNILVQWRRTILCHILPMPQAVWGTHRQRERWSLLDAAASNLVADSVQLLVGTASDVLSTSCLLTDDDAITAVMALFSNREIPVLLRDGSDSNVTDVKRQGCENICSNIVNAACRTETIETVDPCKKQTLLDRLLLQTCSGTGGLAEALCILLTLGADPNIRSVCDSVENGLLPLHFVAANCHGEDGVRMVDELLRSGGDFLARCSNGQRPLNLALKHKNFNVAARLWEAELPQCIGREGKSTERQSSPSKPLPLSSKDVYMLGQAAIACRSLRMLQYSVSEMTRKTDVDDTSDVDCSESRSAAELLGRMVLWCVDERSGFGLGCGSQTKESVSMLQTAVSIVMQKPESRNGGGSKSTILPAFVTDVVSRQSPLHLILRSDRGAELRMALVRPLCELALANEVGKLSAFNADDIGSVTVNPRSPLISLACDAKFGGYTALHYACALGCVESVKTLVHYGADINVVDCKGRSALDLVPKSSLSDLRRYLHVMDST